MRLLSRLRSLFRPRAAAAPAPSSSDLPPQTVEILRQLEPWRAKHRRTAWKPLVEAADGAVTVSKFGGTPWIGDGAPWPECAVCHQPSPLFLQLDLGTLPEALGRRFGEGLLQLFYCTNGECGGQGGWEPFADDLSRVRVVRPTGAAVLSGVPRPRGHFPGKRIVGWEPVEDLPHPPEHEDLGLTYTYDFKGGTVRLDCGELGLSFGDVRDDGLAEHVAEARPGDKLAGWPCWVQGVEYPSCPRCARRMDLVFQVDSEDHVPFMFGDVGCGHVTQCAEHKDVVAFGWACA